MIFRKMSIAGISYGKNPKGKQNIIKSKQI